MSNFVHLHVHSDYSLGDAAVSVRQLADRAAELGMTHLALTDHGTMSGIMEFIAACREKVKPIIGCEVYLTPSSRFEKKGSEGDNQYYHLVLLAANRTGYFNLVKLCSFAATEGFHHRPRIDEEILVQYHEGLIALSACVSGEIPRLIQAGKHDEALQKARWYQDLFGADEKGNPNFYLEIQDHGIPRGALEGSALSQKDINKELAAISAKTGIPLVATNNVHYLNRKDKEAHDVMLCIGADTVRTDEKRTKYYGGQFYLKSGEKMAALFSKYPEAISNTVRIAERCAADVPFVYLKDLPGYLPDFPIPAGFKNADAYLRHLVFEGLAVRYANEKTSGGGEWETIQKRSRYELDTINRMGFSDYFLIVADFVNWAKEHGIPVGPGKGSGAGSIAAYSLRITNIDPVKYKLLFERFLNPERAVLPFLDIDFGRKRRDDVIKYVTEKYGSEQVMRIISFETLGAKEAIRRVGRVLGIPAPELKKISNRISKYEYKYLWLNTLQEAIDDDSALQDYERNPRYTELFSIAKKLEGLNYRSSLHASGLAVGKSAPQNLVPLFKDPVSGSIATQYDSNHLEECGLIKMDFFELETLDVIKRAEELIRQRGGEYAAFSIENISENDEATFKMLGEGKSFEIFMFESEGMRNILRQAKPNSIEDLIALNSLYRPGPMENLPRFIESKNDRQKISYPDPSLEPVLKETYGVIAYQEQVMQIAVIIAGYSMGQADLLRRALGKRKKEIIDKEKRPFIEGAVKRGFPETKAAALFDMLVHFAAYSFNKSHAAAYSLVAYHTAYLKAHFPDEYRASHY